MKPHDCREQADPLAYCGLCARAEEIADSRANSWERDLGMSDLEADRYQRYIERGFGE